MGVATVPDDEQGTKVPGDCLNGVGEVLVCEGLNTIDAGRVAFPLGPGGRTGFGGITCGSTALRQRQTQTEGHC